MTETAQLIKASHREVSCVWGQETRGTAHARGPHGDRCSTCGDRNPQPRQLSRSPRSERSRTCGGSNRLSRSDYRVDG
ncbi:hypothetical protein PoB_001482400 [Plakobranchus ocellatus]|uniref:Uncharacterized protein n=1 Tax=Plakobranchus ocellatus TaxID=259542 RepID=A0AAV3YZ58_9GAST|nr:hypothetical protein PoB_001482400 [Plakobranchus ocellatus]